MAKDPDFLRNLIFSYTTNTTKMIKEMHSSVTSLDFDNLAEIAHALDGSSRSIGASKLAKLADHIYKLSRKKQTDDLFSKLEELTEINEATKSALFSFINVEKTEVI